MALIPCPECHNQVSDKAVVCPHCGVKIASANTIVERQKKKWLNDDDREGRRLNRPIGCTTTLIIFAVIIVIAAIGVTTNHIAYLSDDSSVISGEHSEFEVVDESIIFERRTNNSTVYVTGKITNYREAACYIEIEYAIYDIGGNIICRSNTISEKSIEPGKDFTFKIEYYDEAVQAASFEILKIIGH